MMLEALTLNDDAILVRKALEEFKTALKLDPSDIHAHNSLGHVYDGLGVMDKATEEYREALRLISGKPDIS
jgi:Tfp pilus assembly protein PilF